MASYSVGRNKEICLQAGHSNCGRISLPKHVRQAEIHKAPLRSLPVIVDTITVITFKCIYLCSTYSITSISMIYY